MNEGATNTMELAIVTPAKALSSTTPAEAQEEATNLWEQYEALKTGITQKAFDFVTVCRINQGGVLLALVEKFGRKAMLSFCENIGISQRSADNYINLVKNPNRDLLQRLSLTTAYKTMKMLDDGTLSVEKNVLKFEDGREVDLSAGVDTGVLTELLISHQKLQKKVAAHQNQMNELDAKRTKEVNETNQQNLELEKKLRALVTKSEEALNAQINTAIDLASEVGILLVRIAGDDWELDAEQHRRIRLQCVEYLQTVCMNVVYAFNEKYGEDYQEPIFIPEMLAKMEKEKAEKKAAAETTEG
ncbi:MAG: hypothetical protein BWY28_02157 [bacterium ADurb.Bin236]|nr:MAG: hypothetical protein BWY28_02157 [bacterium ADurb.Bin236]